MTEFDGFPEDLDALLSSLLVALQDPHRPDRAPDEPSLSLPVLLEPLLPNLCEQLLQLAHGSFLVPGEVVREGRDGAHVEGGLEGLQDAEGRGAVGRGEGEVRPRGVETQRRGGAAELSVGAQGCAVRACSRRI